MPKTEANDGPCRRRGRPAGKNRVPLSLAERRARNAQYERERRNEASDAMAQLAEAAGCDISVSNGDLLASVVAQLQREAERDPSDDIETLRRCNEDLMQQIAELEQRLGWSEADGDDKENLQEYRTNTKGERFSRRNILRSNIKRHKTLDTDAQLPVTRTEQETFPMKLFSDD